MTVHYFLTLAEVKARVALSRATIYRWAAAGKFPKPVALSSQTVRWRESDVVQWMADPVAWREPS
jgi:prophage regulatory protein